MQQLCVAPKAAYRHASYHKETKNHWARDDPAFVVICSALVAAVTLAYCLACVTGANRRLCFLVGAAKLALQRPSCSLTLLRVLPPLSRSFSHSFGRSLLTIVSAVAVDFLAVGAAIATAGWALSNRFLHRKNQHSHAVEQSVEWWAARLSALSLTLPCNPRLVASTNAAQVLTAWLRQQTLSAPVPAGCMRLTCTATPSSPCSCCSTCCSWPCARCCSCSASSRGCSPRVRPLLLAHLHAARCEQNSRAFVHFSCANAVHQTDPTHLCPAALYAAGSSYYWYLTFLGYSALPFLERTEVGLLACVW